MPTNPQSERTVAVIDSNSLIHRAYHAVPPTMNAPDGTPTNAVFGFLAMLIKFIQEFHPDALVAAFDAGVPKYRFEAIELYKAQRPPMDDELKVQFPVIEQILVALGVPVVKLEGFEGDDILGSLSAECEREGGQRCLLISGDKDILQLVSEQTHVINTRKGMTDIVDYDPAGVVDKFGVGPELVPDYLGLMGDSSDNIPGVPGVGAKTATKLLQQYGSIEGLYQHADEVKGKLGEKVRANQQMALDSRQVATILRDAPVGLDLQSLHFPDFDSQRLRQVMEGFGLHSQLRKLLGLLDGAEDANPRQA
ncbi:MAG: DNA polymerase I, partial [Coriobacteriales bacterium]|nr:DNA polymerase I [Coriobacteriales bacterium]